MLRIEHFGASKLCRARKRGRLDPRGLGDLGGLGAARGALCEENRSLGYVVRFPRGSMRTVACAASGEDWGKPKCSMYHLVASALPCAPILP